MKILVCVKQVPEFENTAIAEGNDGEAVMDEFSEYRMNRFDEFAVEEAIRIKENIPGTLIDVITVGPERAGDVLRRAMGMGADQGIHLLTSADHCPGPSEIAARISDVADKKGYDLIFTGAMSEDGMNGQVGPAVAGHLDLPGATQVIAMNFSDDKSGIDLEREVEGGNRELLHLMLPAVVSVQTGINQPRYPSLSNLLRANKQPLETVETGDSGGPASDEIERLIIPQKMRAGRHLDGSAREKAVQLISFLQERALI